MKYKVLEIIGWLVLSLVVYPVTLWVVLDYGFLCGLGMGRVYAMWMGVLMLIVTGVIAVFLLVPDDPNTNKKPRQIWRQF